jgi:uncharacterized protein YjbJ (UPF0337 family)
MDNADQIKGRVKEAAGDLTNNDDLKREGQTDRAAGKTKEVIDNVTDKASETVDALKDKIHDISKR